jgi:hypothetical protein
MADYRANGGQVASLFPNRRSGVDAAHERTDMRPRANVCADCTHPRALWGEPGGYDDAWRHAAAFSNGMRPPRKNPCRGDCLRTASIAARRAQELDGTAPLHGRVSAASQQEFAHRQLAGDPVRSSLSEIVRDREGHRGGGEMLCRRLGTGWLPRARRVVQSAKAVC